MKNLTSPHRVLLASASLVIALTAGCTTGPGGPAAPSAPTAETTAPAAAPGSELAQLNQIQKDYDVTLEIQGHQINLKTAGNLGGQKMTEIVSALRKVYGADFNNYTVVQSGQ